MLSNINLLLRILKAADTEGTEGTVPHLRRYHGTDGTNGTNGTSDGLLAILLRGYANLCRLGSARSLRERIVSPAFDNTLLMTALPFISTV